MRVGSCWQSAEIVSLTCLDLSGNTNKELGVVRTVAGEGVARGLYARKRVVVEDDVDPCGLELPQTTLLSRYGMLGVKSKEMSGKICVPTP